MDRYFTPFKMISRLVMSLLVVGFLGWLLGYPYELISVYLIGLVLWNSFYQLRLSRWLWQSRATQPPQAPGAWSDIYDGIYRTVKRSQVRRRSLARILQRFREAAETIPDAGLVIENDGSLVWSNKLAQIYFGLQWPTDKGIRITNLIRHPRFIKYFRDRDFTDAITLTSPAGDKREIELRIMPYANAQLLVIARDVTHIRKLERMRKDFVANVSHELKTPLTVMQGYLELMEDPNTLAPERMAKAMADITAQTQRMQLLVEQLLTLSRMATNSQETFTEQVAMGPLLQTLVAEVGLMVESHKVRLHTAIDNELVVLGHVDKLRAAAHNLLVNAIKYAGEGAVITLTWQRQQGEAFFSVQDNGPGIAATHLARLTERFYRITEDRNSKTGGTGLGLSIVKHSLESHRSHLQIESTLGQGSCFYFRIPRALVVPQKLLS